MAAVMHDFDHPGRTNAFLVATRDPLVCVNACHKELLTCKCLLFCNERSMLIVLLEYICVTI